MITPSTIDMITPSTSDAATEPTAPAEHAPALLACATCGVAVATPDDAETFTLREPMSLPWGGPHPLPLGAFKEGATFTRCPSCRERHEHAAEVMARHPHLVARLGNVAGDKLARALDALAALGQPAGADDAEADELNALMRHLTPAGSAVQWSRQPDAGAVPADALPWHHVGPEQRRILNDALVPVLSRRVAKVSSPVRVGPSDGRGCLLCGVGQVELSAVHVADLGGVKSAQAHLWHPVTGVDPAAVGGRPGADRVSGHLCGACDDARSSAGAFGHAAMAAAYVAHLKAAGRHQELATLAGWERDPDIVHGLVAWGALVGRREPNAEPWQHLTGRAEQ